VLQINHRVFLPQALWRRKEHKKYCTSFSPVLFLPWLHLHLHHFQNTVSIHLYLVKSICYQSRQCNYEADILALFIERFEESACSLIDIMSSMCNRMLQGTKEDISSMKTEDVIWGLRQLVSVWFLFSALDNWFALFLSSPTRVIYISRNRPSCLTRAVVKWGSSRTNT